jgi:hypothetical protein
VLETIYKRKLDCYVVGPLSDSCVVWFDTSYWTSAICSPSWIPFMEDLVNGVLSFEKTGCCLSLIRVEDCFGGIEWSYYLGVITGGNG